ncbi:hypothetical protein [Pectobacterium polaris]|uniref:hypothetical protein n=1 Tax=Pectobacterium polaris TaxID=2042057 RepID=UPI000F96263F|nr:hypothetical protein [Pectobacterium polaris]RUS02578.1 hypothetical protein KHDHEBDM_00286 [Pectobacterium polaris]
MRNDLKETSKIMYGIINLGRYLYTIDHFYEFYVLISRSLHSHVRYGFYDDDYSLFDLYLYTVRQNLLYRNYKSFELNTKFLTEELRYLEHADDGESLSKIESKMVQCVKGVVTLILIRLDYLLGKKNEDDNEIISLCDYLKSWVNAAFFEDVYYKEGTYDALFIIPREPDFDASRILREIPDYQTSSVSISNDTYKAIASIMTQSSFNKNNFNPIFIRDKKEFLEKTEITTFQLQEIISYLRGENFSEVLGMIEGNSSDKSSKESIAEYLESMVIEKNDMITNFIAYSELDGELVQKYINEISLSLSRYLGKILDIEALPISNSASSDTSYSLINKREVVRSVDGVHYTMSGRYHAEVGVHYWIKNVLDKVKENKKNIIEIESIKELTTDRLVTIQYMVKGESGVYHYSKGLRLNDEKGVLGLGDAGLYYMDLENDFSFYKGQSLFDTLIEKTSTENIELMGGESFFGRGNPLLYARLAVTINLELIEKEDYIFYFLSLDNCKKLTALRDHSVCVTSDTGTLLNDSNSIS